ncbi:hypothetical protein Rsub_03570 [Raphidocelis subcapitata]|uniref:SnoaL-like domain-containing protein n=1 Tax=Raphidocelis subcapitata TaxID=307507 RepID=A0A2V0P080_9CHLO|nr:hypothetical protein Rsub_03570 [Raphidocelis subcapitata]|eukprot:GBF91250.1 hypothetical protein Rsub_03570 [Raphidocelis subcapitata]
MAGSLAAAKSAYRPLAGSQAAPRALVRAHRAPRSQRASAALRYPVATEERAKRLELFYTEAWGNGTPELLPELCASSVTYCDARGGGCDAFGCRGLAAMIEGVCSSHPLLRIELDDVTFDDSGATAVAEWHATAAHLLPGTAGGAASGLVSEICGLDEVHFDLEGRISSILSFRERFAEERAEEGADGADADADAAAGAASA